MPGFESPDIADGTTQTGSPVGWTGSGDIKLSDYSTVQWSNKYAPGETVPDGNQVFTLIDGQIEQLFSTDIQADTTYTIIMDVGCFIDTGVSRVKAKLIGSSVLGDQVVFEFTAAEHGTTSNTASTLIQGKWATQKVSWDSSHWMRAVEDQLKIEIVGNDVDIDNIRLCIGRCVQDIDNDCDMDFWDLAMLVSKWLDGT